SLSNVVAWLEKIASLSLAALLPLFALLVAAGVFANLFPTRPVFSAEPLKPDFDRINPFSGLSRIFLVRVLVEAGKSVFKLALLGAALYLVLTHGLPQLAALNQLDPRGLAPVLLDWCSRIILVMLPIIAAVAAADFLYTRWSYLGRMKM